MCVSLPGRVIELDGPMVTVDTAGVMRRCSSLMFPELQVGDRVLLHGGFVIEVISEQRAREMEDAFVELGVLEESPRPAPELAEVRG